MDASEAREEDKPLRITSAVDVIGEWSPLQIRLLVFYMVLYVISPFQNSAIIFIVPKIKYWCVRPPGFENVTLEDECQSPADPSQPCTEWEYDKSIFWTTAVSEFDLVCGRSWIPSISASAYQFGYAVAAIIFGFISDKYGRRFAIKLAIYMEIVSGFSQALSVNVYHFLISRFALGISAFGRFFTGYLLIFECFGQKNRAPISAFIELGFAVGSIILPLVYYLLPNFRYVQLIISSLEVLALFWLRNLPESLRWQLTHNKFDEAQKAMREAAVKDGKLSEEELRRRLVLLEEHVKSEEEQLKEARKQTLLDLWKAPNMLKYCLILYFTFFVQGFVGYGIGVNLGDLGVNLFLTKFLMSISDVVSNVAQFFAFKKWNRLPLMFTALVTGAVCCFCLSFILWFNLHIAYRVIIATLFTFVGSFSFRLTYIQGTEIIPTTMRQLGVGSCTVAVRVGSIIAPFVREFSEFTHVAVSMAIFGGLKLTDGLLIYILPETKGVEIPDTVEEASNMKKKNTNVPV